MVGRTCPTENGKDYDYINGYDGDDDDGDDDDGDDDDGDGDGDLKPGES